MAYLLGLLTIPAIAAVCAAVWGECALTGTAFFFKQWGTWGLEGEVAHYLAKDGTLYAPEDLTYPDGPRYGEALRAGHNRGLHTVYRVGKKRAGRELDGRTWDEYPGGEG